MRPTDQETTAIENMVCHFLLPEEGSQSAALPEQLGRGLCGCSSSVGWSGDRGSMGEMWARAIVVVCMGRKGRNWINRFWTGGFE